MAKINRSNPIRTVNAYTTPNKKKNAAAVRPIAKLYPVSSENESHLALNPAFAASMSEQPNVPMTRTLRLGIRSCSVTEYQAVAALIQVPIRFILNCICPVIAKFSL